MDESVLTGAAYTIETAIRAAAEQFERNDLYFGHGTDTALDEASWLILYAMNLSVAHEPDYARMLSADEVARCNALLLRRIRERIPAAYITGEAWFAGHRFICDSRALVPRSPLAEFITHQFFGLLEGITQPRILDLCTGGGSIAIACAHAAPNATVHASDLSSEALALAGDNVALHQLQQQVQLFHGSLFEPLEQQYDLIISNPPYVDARDVAAMPEEFLHEPMMGLAAGADGLDLVRVMLREAARYLKPEGTLVVEVGNSWHALEAAYPDLDFGWLEFTQGGDGVFVLRREELVKAE